MKLWRNIIKFQNQFYSHWRKEKPRLLFAVGLSGEVGEVCGVITHLDGGGTNNNKYTEMDVLHECADVYVMLVLLIERSGFSEADFENELHNTMNILNQRLEKRQRSG